MNTSMASTPITSFKNAIRELVRPIKFWYTLKTQPRQNKVYTQFNRFPHQYQALIEKVIPRFIDADGLSTRGPLRIAVFACCTGAEPFSLAYTLRSYFPKLEFNIQAYDIVKEVVEQAKTGRYTQEEVDEGDFINNEFIESVFDRVDGGLEVKQCYRAPVSFDVGDMLDAESMSSIGNCDLVFAQNVLFHLPADLAVNAFSNLCNLLSPSSVLFINGMDTDMRIKYTKKLKLFPLNYLVEEIHNDARVNRGAGWANQYWGRGPFSTKSREWVRKFGTIYSPTEWL